MQVSSSYVRRYPHRSVSPRGSATPGKFPRSRSVYKASRRRDAVASGHECTTRYAARRGLESTEERLPLASLIDSALVRGTNTPPAASRGSDARIRASGREHDINCLLLSVLR